jgi:DNA repair photolyase
MKKTVFGTKEWASSTLNLKQTGCPSCCVYCFASAMAIQYKRATPKSWGTPVVNGVPKFGKRAGTIMMPSTHDIRESNVDAFIEMMTTALNAGNDVLIVSKPALDVIRKVVMAIPAGCAHQVLFRFTIGSADDNILSLWEPHAPAFAERLSSLCMVHGLGFETSVSCEPMLDSDIHRVVEQVRPFVTDAIWLGKANSLVQRVSTNTAGNPEWLARARALDKLWTDEAVRALYERYKDDPKVKWKESLKKILGIAVPTKAGLDI